MRAMIVRRAGSALAVLVFVAAVFVALAAVVVPKAIGAVPYTVLTGSMRPTYPPGTLVVVGKADTDEVKIGDVVTYLKEPGRPEVVTHRVTGVTNTSGGVRTFTTQGDANSSPDPDPVLPVQVRGTVLYSLPLLGYVNSALDAQERGIVVTALAVALIGYGLVSIVLGLRRPRARGRHAG